MPSKDSKSTIANNIEDINAQFHQESLFADASDSFDSAPSISDIDFDPCASNMSTANNYRIRRNLKNNQKLKTKLNSARVRNQSNEENNNNNNNSSAITTVDEDSLVSVSGSNFLYYLAGLVIKIMEFQLSLLFSSVTLPIWLISYSYMFMSDPFRTMNIAKHYLLRKISIVFGLCCNSVEWKLCIRIGWGLLWSVYIGFVLSSLLVFAFVVSGIILKCVIEEPIRITRELNFDYTKESPVAFAPLVYCHGSLFLESGEPVWSGSGVGSRVIPLGHEVRVMVSLTLPESDYNRNLGIFQVRVDFLSSDGKQLASTRQPCMLRYKSQPIRLLLTFLKLAPLIAGYSLESQTLNIKLSGYTEGTVPTSCLRVILEQRAEFTRGAGVPVIYEASLKLESKPPFLKRLLWSWKWTVYIWTTVMIFVVELLFIVVCCTPVIVARLQPRGV